MEILGITVHLILLALLFATPWTIVFFRLRAKKKTGFIYMNVTALPASFLLIVFMAYWPHFFADFRLELMNFDFDGMTDYERTRNVDPSHREEANRLYSSNMGIGWPLQVIMAMMYFFPYPSVVLIIINISFWIKNAIGQRSRQP